ncbi:MAG TPA: 3-isopropylmalate dehydratase [Firmicutes bacterium]|nr:3-isopropylmalate dehydratase [Bacillota bacterium]
MHGRAFVLGDDVNTDHIISGRRRSRSATVEEMARYVFEDIRPDLVSRLQPGDFVVAGENFGCGSSREQAPQALKAAGVGGIIARSFARLFYRNAVNIGLPVIILPGASRILEGDELRVDWQAGRLVDVTAGFDLTFSPLPSLMARILEAGGLIPFLLGGGNLGPAVDLERASPGGMRE